MFSDDACPQVNVHANRNIVHRAQDNPHVAADAHHQTNTRITVCCTIHGNNWDYCSWEEEKEDKKKECMLKDISSC